MRTLFAMHCITKRNKDDHYNDKKLQELGYDESKLHFSQMPSEIDYATGQVDESLIEKGRYQALMLAQQLSRISKITWVKYYV